MIKKYLSFALCCLLVITVSSGLTGAQTTQTEANIVKVKNRIFERGTGEKKRVEVRLTNGTKLKGYISQRDENSFTLVNSETKQSSTIAYADVAKVSNRMSKGDKIALVIIAGAAITAAVVLGVFLKTYCDNENC